MIYFVKQNWNEAKRGGSLQKVNRERFWNVAKFQLKMVDGGEKQWRDPLLIRQSMNKNMNQVDK